MPKTINPTTTMRRVDPRPLLSRREFLNVGGAAALSLGALPTLAIAGDETAFPNLGADVGTALLRIARDIYPHDRLAEVFYVEAIQPYDAKAGTDEALRTLLRDGVAELDSAAKKAHGQRYVDVSEETKRVALLQAVEPSAFFQKVRGDLVTGLYNNKKLWPQFGYEGSSWQKGGYLNRGFNDLDWL